MNSCQKEIGENEEDLTQEQINILESSFKKCKTPDWADVMLLSAEAGLTEQEIMKWFRHRLSKWRRSEGLPSECGSVMD
ncbi:homeodomain-only protein [Pseudophryne corroboree]|uniref:homeodomain-only protein n=1 Tax=Pseudophryne corroboree TaxID=495146 RepID=UPI0030817E40